MGQIPEVPSKEINAETGTFEQSIREVTSGRTVEFAQFCCILNWLSMIGKTVQHYRIIGKLGVGGMGVVYEADDTHLSRRVALKFLPEDLTDDRDATRRFQREAQTIALLNHPHICTVHAIDEFEGRWFIAMERLEGMNLKLYLARKKLETATILDFSVQIADALGAAHSKGIVHRDIKPGNIFVSDSNQVKVLDFGLARRYRNPDTGETGLEGSTLPGRPIGTANYMAPERILQMPLDPRSDLFSLGVVIYEMATERLPFSGGSPSDTVTNILERAPIRLTKLSPHRPVALERVVNRLLAKRADNRYQSAEEVREELSAFRGRRS